MANFEPFLVSDALLQQAEQRFQSRLAQDPDNRVLLDSLGKLYRKQGRIPEAAAVYERLRALDPSSHETAYIHALLTGSEPPARLPGLQPAPFLLLKNFLPRAFHEILMPTALSVQDQLTPAMVGNEEYKPEVRESLELRAHSDIHKRFDAHVRQFLPSVISRLKVPSFEIGKVQVSLRTYLDGHFFRLHMDCPADGKNADRTVSYVYFYHKVPRAYTGGDLLMFDTDMANDKFTTSGFTSIQPEDNTIVFFPSACYHSVVPVRCPSKAFEDSRFVINGHVSKRVAKPEVEVPAGGAVLAVS